MILRNGSIIAGMTNEIGNVGLVDLGEEAAIGIALVIFDARGGVDDLESRRDWRSSPW